MSGRRVLVTGAAGFLGRQTAAPLAQRGFEVHAVTCGEPRNNVSLQDLTPSGVANRVGVHAVIPGEPPGGQPAVFWHRADLLDPAAAEALCVEVRPTHLLHLAWYTVHGRFWTSPENFRWVAASLGLLEAFARRGGERVVSAGSCAEYDWSVAQTCSERETPLKPATPYGACKDALRRLQESFARLRGLSQAWGRVFFPFGPHEHPDRFVPHVVRRLLRGEPAECTSGTQVRDLVYVGDAGEAFAALLDGAVEGPVNVGSGRPVALRDAAAEIARQVGRPDLLRMGARPDRPDDPPLLAADTARLSGEVGWRPARTLESGLAETIAWWRERGAR